MVHNMEENWREFWKGVLAQLPVQLGVIPFGLVFGVLGIASGLTATQTILMSSIIFGGASQVVFAQLWSSGTSPIITGGSVAIINMRHIIYSANVSFYISSLPLRWRIILGYLLTDEAFAVSFQEFENKNKFAHYHLLGGGLTLWVFWQISTVIGVFLGANFTYASSHVGSLRKFRPENIEYLAAKLVKPDKIITSQII